MYLWRKGRAAGRVGSGRVRLFSAIAGRVGSDQRFAGSGRVGSKKSDPWTTLLYVGLYGIGVRYKIHSDQKIWNIHLYWRNCGISPGDFFHKNTYVYSCPYQNKKVVLKDLNTPLEHVFNREDVARCSFKNAIRFRIKYIIHFSKYYKGVFCRFSKWQKHICSITKSHWQNSKHVHIHIEGYLP